MIKDRFPLKKIITAGLIVGTFDIILACIDAWLSFNLTLGRLLRYIGSAAMDPKTSSSTGMMIFGIVAHYFIALSFTFLFYFIYPFLKKALKNNIVIGLLYGVFIWTVMRFIVLPLTRLTLQPFDLVKSIKPMLILGAAIGIPLSFMMQRLRKQYSHHVKEVPEPEHAHA